MPFVGMFVLARDVCVQTMPQQWWEQPCPTPQPHQVLGLTDGISYLCLVPL